MKTVALIFSVIFFPFAVAAAEVGSKAPDFNLNAIKNVSSEKINLVNYKGKVVYVDFWASWCVPCQHSFPALDAIRAKYKDRGFEVIAINLDENVKDANKFLDKFSVSFPIAQDSTGKIGEVYELRGMPTAFIVDRQGYVKHIVTGFDEKKEVAAIESTLEVLLSNK